MALPVINFAALQPQGNPGLRGIIPSIMQGLQLGYAPSMMSEDLERQRLANALSRINLETAPEMNQAELAYKQAQTPHINAQTNLTNLHSQFYPELTRSNLNHQTLQNAILQEELKYLPLDKALKLFNISGKPNRFGPAFELNRALSQMAPAAREKWIGQNTEEYMDMVNSMAQAAKEERENKNQGNPILDSLKKQYFPDLAKEEFQLGDAQQKALLEQGLAKIGEAPRMSPIPQQLPVTPQMIASSPGFQTSPEQAEQLRTASDISSNNRLITNFTKEQQEGAIQIAHFFNDPEFRRVAKNAAQYAGALGKGKAFVQALSQENPEAFTDYLAFKDKWFFYLKNRVKKLERLGSTDKQREELNKMGEDTLNSFASNPDRFLIGLNQLGAASEAMAKGVYASSNPLGGRPAAPEIKPIPLTKQNSEQKNGGLVVVSPKGKKLVIHPNKVEEFLSAHPEYMRLR